MKVKKPKRIIVYDLETNGLSAVMDRILQVALVVFDVTEQRIVRTYTNLVKIGNNQVDYFVYFHNGWTREFLNLEGKELRQVVEDVYEILHEEEDCVVSGYNIRQFDNKFFGKYVRRFSLRTFPFEAKSFDCSLDYKAHILGHKKAKCPGNWKELHDTIIVNHYGRQMAEKGYRSALKDACDFYGIDVKTNEQHDARYDTAVTFEMLRRQRPDWIKKKQEINFENYVYTLS